MKLVAFVVAEAQVATMLLQRVAVEAHGAPAKVESVGPGLPKDVGEYVVARDVLDVVEPTPGERFTNFLDNHYPSCRKARAGRNALPLGVGDWRDERKEGD